MADRRNTRQSRRGRETNGHDLPYTMKLPDGRTVYVEVPHRYVITERSGEVGFTPAGVRFLDRVRALATPLTAAPSPAYIATLRHALGMTQAQLAQRLGVSKLTISRWERGALKPGPDSLKALSRVAATAKRKGVLLAG
jgi:hypothetical protein